VRKFSAKIGGRAARQKRTPIQQKIYLKHRHLSVAFFHVHFYGVRRMKLADQLSVKDKKKLDRLTSPKKERKMSQDEIEDLMGMHRDTYKRVHGKIRRR
jgi:hypothetical protein